MNQNKPQPDKAVFKLVCYFKDGNKREFYSYHTAYDAQTGKVTINDKIALNKLIRLIQYKFAQKYKTAIIYHSPTAEWTKGTPGIRQVTKYCYDKMIQESQYQFTWINNAVKFALQ